MVDASQMATLLVILFYKDDVKIFVVIVISFHSCVWVGVANLILFFPGFSILFQITGQRQFVNFIFFVNLWNTASQMSLNEESQHFSKKCFC